MRTLHPDDVIREHEKIGEALVTALKHHKLRDESNAQLHLSSTTRYSPLTTKLEIALDSWSQIRKHLDGLS